MYYVGMYILGIVCAPLVLAVLWFIGAFFYSYIGGNELDDGELNYFAFVLNEGILEMNVIVGWLLWPLGIAIGTIVCIGFVVYHTCSWLGSSMNLNKFSLTDRINNSIRSRKKK
jgi:uncharacterized membrane protein YciS (DUF1049 family)